MIAKTISNALYRYLSAQLRTSIKTRRFFRLDGFDDETYRYLLETVRNVGNILSNQQIQVRTTAPISGFAEYARESGKSATWYRNNVPDGHALILIFNERTSDAQSLKDIYAITESDLGDSGLDFLLGAAFTDYQLNPNQIQVLKSFLTRLRRNLFKPQLRDLVAFLNDLNSQLYKDRADSIELAIAEALPHLGLFRCRALADSLNTQRGDKLLGDLYRATTRGNEILEERQLEDFLKRLDEADFIDDRDYGGLSSTEKKDLLRSFLTRVLTDRVELMQVLQLEWNEVESVLHKKARKTQEEKLKQLAQAIEEALTDQNLTLDDLSEEAQEGLEDLTQGIEPDTAIIDHLITEQQDALGKPLTNQLHRLSGAKSHPDTDFIARLTSIVIELLASRQDELVSGTTLQVHFDKNQLGEIEEKKQEALLAFRAIYGGIEKWMTTIQWDLTELWALTNQYHVEEDVEFESREEVTGNPKMSLTFRVTLRDVEGNELDRADLVWLYFLNGSTAATLANLKAEAKRIDSPVSSGPLFSSFLPRLTIPLYNTCPDPEDVSDLNLSQPVKSLGAWYDKPGDLRQILREELSRRSNSTTIAILDKVLDNLELAWAEFVSTALTDGIFTVNSDRLFSNYEALLATAAEQLRGGQEAAYGFRILAQAWIVGPPHFDHWAVVPFLHPLKLHWWNERTRYFNEIITKLLSTHKAIIEDERRFRQELTTTYGSTGYPALLALPGLDRRPTYFLPVDEVEGYELYRQINQAGVAHGLDPDLVSETESVRAADIVAQELSRVVRDYIETYPFTRDGLEIYLIECRNSILPVLLVEWLDKLSRRLNWSLRLSVNVHTRDRGAPLYRRIKDWLKAHETFIERPLESYFPQVSLKILEENEPANLFSQIEDTDLVILADVLAESGQQVEIKFESLQGFNESIPLNGYLPIYRSQQAPFEHGELVREILLTSPIQPSLLSHFYNAQWAAAEARRAIPLGEVANFRQIISLRDWEILLNNLHRNFNWVVCYDTTIDRFLLEETFPDTVQVIRYSLGLGIKRQHNLTVSSSYRAQDIVVRRLTTRLNDLLPGTPDDFREKVARRLVDEAKQVSGDIVLRAAGPGAYLNELIGLMLAKHFTEHHYLAEHPGALTAWIYLDDFAHWFDRKFPDLLFVAIPSEANGELPIYIEILETKCIGETSFTAEVVDAQRQVREGINRLGRVWAAGAEHLDATYWYDQLYRAVVGNLSIERNQERLWKAFRNRLPKGDFTLHLSGHSWVFCYDSTAGITGFVDEGVSDKSAPDVPEVGLFYRHYSRAGLRKMLRTLVENEWQLQAPSETWAPIHDEPTLTPNIFSHQPIIDVTQVGEASFPEIAIPSSVGTTSSTPPLPPKPSINREWLNHLGQDLEHVLRDYGVRAYPIDPSTADIGPSVIRFKIRLRPGEQLSRLQRSGEDLARELRLTSIPLIDNILGTRYVGIDVPRPDPEIVPLLPLLDGLPQPAPAALPIILGCTPDGQTIIEDLSEFPHLLVAGATNSGKSVFLRSILLGLMKLYEPYKIHFLIVDPKRTDFTFFDGLPYLLGGKVITDNEQARDILVSLALGEMPKRQEIMSGRSMKIKDFNQRYPDEALPPIVAIIDEYAQLLSIMNRKERAQFERDLMSLAAVARATGIHLILATQRPSADVVTGTLKANLPASVAFKVASAVNSRIIIDQSGAENLLGRGDMLFRRPSGEIIRLQAPFVDEIELIKILEKFKS